MEFEKVLKIASEQRQARYNQTVPLLPEHGSTDGRDWRRGQSELEHCSVWRRSIPREQYVKSIAAQVPQKGTPQILAFGEHRNRRDLELDHRDRRVSMDTISREFVGTFSHPMCEKIASL